MGGLGCRVQKWTRSLQLPESTLASPAGFTAVTLLRAAAATCPNTCCGGLPGVVPLSRGPGSPVRWLPQALLHGSAAWARS